MDLSFAINEKSGIPIYIQILEQIKHQIATGVLQPGEQLPTIRELAVTLTINLHTAAHAYAELEREGYLTVQRGRGTFVTNGHSLKEQELEDMRERKLRTLVESLFVDALSLGYGATEVRHAIATHMERWQKTTNQQVGDTERD